MTEGFIYILEEDLDKVFLDPESVARFGREWDSSAGEKNMQLRKTDLGKDILEISTDGSSRIAYVNQLLLQHGQIVLENEMGNDLIDKK